MPLSPGRAIARCVRAGRDSFGLTDRSASPTRLAETAGEDDMFEAIRSYLPVGWRRPFELLAAPHCWIADNVDFRVRQRIS